MPVTMFWLLRTVLVEFPEEEEEETVGNCTLCSVRQAVSLPREDGGSPLRETASRPIGKLVKN